MMGKMKNMKSMKSMKSMKKLMSGRPVMMRLERMALAMLEFWVGLFAGGAWFYSLASHIVRSGRRLLPSGSAGVHVGQAPDGGLPMRRIPVVLRAQPFTAIRKVAGLPAGPP
ncbi:hypothetical protein ACFPVX_23305 [Cohnella faecalis]|nr:hypothetical protein [Cohnella faecalis]